MPPDPTYPSDAAPAKTTTVAAGDWLVGLGILVVTQLVYTLTLFPTVAYGDSGTLTSVACTLGIAHPPGYPLYTLIANVFTKIPLGTLAWRVNLASAVFGSGAALFLYLTVLRLTRHRAAAALAAGMYAFSPLVWHYSLLAEVFSLNNLFATILAYLSVRFWQQREEKILYLLAFVTGLGLAHHHTLVFWAGPVWLWLGWVARSDVFHRGRLLTCGAFISVGLTPYIYLRITALRDPVVVWGDLSSWAEFFRHVSRFRYGTLSLVPGNPGDAGDIMRSLGFFFRTLPSQMLFVGVLVALWGLYQGVRNHATSSFMKLTVIAYFFYVVVFHALARLPVNDDGTAIMHLHRFWLLPGMFPFVWIGYGAYDILARTVVPRRAVWVVALAVVGLQCVVHYGEQNQRNNWTFFDRARLMLQHLPKGSLLLSEGDWDNHTLQYAQTCEHLRDDVAVVSMNNLMVYWAGPVAKRHYDDVVFPGDVLVLSREPFKGQRMGHIHGREIGMREAYSLSYLFEANVDRRPVFTTDFRRNRNFAGAGSWSKDFTLLPMGPLNKVVRVGEEPTFDTYVDESLVCLPDLERITRDTPTDGSREYRVSSEYWNDYGRFFVRAFSLIDKPGVSRRGLDKMASVMESFEAGYPAPLQVRFYWDLALVYSMLSDEDPGRAAALDQLWRRRLYSQKPPLAQHEHIREMMRQR